MSQKNVAFLVLSILAFQFQFAKAEQLINATCLFGGVMHKCQVTIDGNSLLIGGFQSAPIFKLTEGNSATDHRDNKYTITLGNDYMMFTPVNHDYSSLRINSMNIRQIHSALPR